MCSCAKSHASCLLLPHPHPSIHSFIHSFIHSIHSFVCSFLNRRGCRECVCPIMPSTTSSPLPPPHPMAPSFALPSESISMPRQPFESSPSPATPPPPPSRLGSIAPPAAPAPPAP